jgi:hypothetical protein
MALVTLGDVTLKNCLIPLVGAQPSSNEPYSPLRHLQSPCVPSQRTVTNMYIRDYWIISTCQMAGYLQTKELCGSIGTICAILLTATVHILFVSLYRKWEKSILRWSSYNRARGLFPKVRRLPLLGQRWQDESPGLQAQYDKWWRSSESFIYWPGSFEFENSSLVAPLAGELIFCIAQSLSSWFIVTADFKNPTACQTLGKHLHCTLAQMPVSFFCIVPLYEFTCFNRMLSENRGTSEPKDTQTIS